jgi:cell division septum initiation protein DivIVA
MSIAQRDLKLLQIESVIKHKKALLIKKKKDLEKKVKVNSFLEDVNADYSKYYQHIVQEKQNQYNALNLLKEYMGDLIQTETLIDDHLRTAKHDQQDIIREINVIKGELDVLIE